MKIYYVANARMPTEKAHGIQIAKMCEAFIEAGAGIELIVPRRMTDERTIREFYGLRVDVPVKKNWAPDWYGSGRLGFGVSSLVFALGYFFYLLVRRYRGERFIVYTTDIDQFSFFLIPFLGVPYFVEMHDAKKKTWPFGLLLSRAQGIIVINRIIQRELAHIFALKEGIFRVLPNAVDLSAFRNREERGHARDILGIPQDRRIAMYVGFIYAWKGLDILPVVAGRMADVIFYIVGGTAQELRALGALDEQPANLICVGRKPFQEIPRWMRAADVLIATGTNKNPYSSLHTSPMKLFEYAAAERPIVAAATPAIREIFRQSGDQQIFFYTPDDAGDLERAIRSVFVDKKSTANYVEYARNLIAKHQWKCRAELTLEFMQRVL